MNKNRTTERYRGHDLVFVMGELVCKGKAWVIGTRAKPLEAYGAGAQTVRDELHALIDNALVGADPTKEYVRALKTLLAEPRPDSDWAMLKAHYNAPDRTATAKELATAIGFPNYNTINIRYGLLGQAIYEEALVDLPADARHPDGKPIYTFVIATGERVEGENWRWTMRPEVAAAIEALGLSA